jgi:hypothetical protein
LLLVWGRKGYIGKKSAATRSSARRNSPRILPAGDGKAQTQATDRHPPSCSRRDGQEAQGQEGCKASRVLRVEEESERLASPWRRRLCLRLPSRTTSRPGPNLTPTRKECQASLRLTSELARVSLLVRVRFGPGCDVVRLGSCKRW